MTTTTFEVVAEPGRRKILDLLRDGPRPGGDDLLRWELEPKGDGCRLVLLHIFDDRFKAARDAAGWHLCLDALETRLAGASPGAPTGERAIPGGWPELNAAYEQRFGIPP